MDPRQAALIQQLKTAPPAPAMPPPGEAESMEPGGEMDPAQATQILQQLGITPDKLPVVAQAIEAVMKMQPPSGGAPNGQPPQPMPAQQ